MNNHRGSGSVLDLVAPSGGVVSGAPVKIGSLLIVPETTAAEGETFAGRITGEYRLASDTGTAWAAGDLLYWDNTAKVLTKTTTSNTKAGVAVAAKLSAATTAIVVLIPTL